MTDFIVLPLLLIACAVAVGYFNGDWRARLREEWRLMRSYQWIADDPHDVGPQRYTKEHPDVQRTITRLADAKKRMKRDGIKLLSENRPAWQKIVRGDAPKHDATITQFKRGKR